MPAVRGGIDQNIFRLLFQSALNDCLQVLVFDLKFLKGKIVHINDEFVIPVLDLRNHLVQILELMLVNLNDPKPLIIVTVQDRLDA